MQATLSSTANQPKEFSFENIYFLKWLSTSIKTITYSKTETYI